MICINCRFSPVQGNRALQNHRNDTAGADQSDIVVCIEQGDAFAPNDFPSGVTTQADQCGTSACVILAVLFTVCFALV